MLSPVALVFCSGYDEEEVERAVRRGFALFGGPEALCPGVKSVLLKPNLLVGEVPERAVTTHPAVFRAVAKVFLEAGYHGVEVDFPEGIQHRKFTIARGVREYDALVSLPKWKTHGLTRVTGAVKNQLGCVPGIRKGEYHFRIPDAILFSRMLVDLNRLLRPAFFVMDAVVAMEGNGPRNGKPRFMGLLAFSRDPVALDATLARLIHLDPALVPTCSEGERLGLGTWRREAIVLWGDDPERFEQRDFEVLRLPQVSPSRKPFLPLVRRFLLPYPVIRRKLCKGCGVCTEVCPVHPKALRWSESIRLPSIEYARCIRCFVCQEVCPHGAILVGVPLVRRVLGKMA
jgi:uncharacterized protein (DUF362 family)/Pyruvate/2-oxoacid:ferredoxin oxidoreductase delta subunit